MATAYIMVGQKDGMGRKRAARVANYVSVAKDVTGNDGVSFDMWAAITNPRAFDDKELRVLLALCRLLGNRSGKDQRAHLRFNIGHLAADVGCDQRTLKKRLAGLAARNVIHFAQVGRHADNTTHEIGWHLDFGDWPKECWQFGDGEECHSL